MEEQEEKRAPPEYRTINIDLAAALIAHGVTLVGAESVDGVTVEFIFPYLFGAQEDVHGRMTSAVAAEWSKPGLLVDAKEVTRARRYLQVQVRKVQEEYARSRRAVIRKTYGQ